MDTSISGLGLGGWLPWQQLTQSTYICTRVCIIHTCVTRTSLNIHFWVYVHMLFVHMYTCHVTSCVAQAVLYFWVYFSWGSDRAIALIFSLQKRIPRYWEKRAHCYASSQCVSSRIQSLFLLPHSAPFCPSLLSILESWVLRLGSATELHSENHFPRLCITPPCFSINTSVCILLKHG